MGMDGFNFLYVKKRVQMATGIHGEENVDLLPFGQRHVADIEWAVTPVVTPEADGVAHQRKHERNAVTVQLMT